MIHRCQMLLWLLGAVLLVWFDSYKHPLNFGELWVVARSHFWLKRNSALWCLPVNRGVRKDRSNMSHGKAYMVCGCGNWMWANRVPNRPLQIMSGIQTEIEIDVIVEHHGLQETPTQATQDPRMQQTGQSTQDWQQNGQIHPVQAGIQPPTGAPGEPPAVSLGPIQSTWPNGKQTSQAWFRNIGTLSPPKSRKPSREWGPNRWHRNQTS